jgi:hypothetical protein
MENSQMPMEDTRELDGNVKYSKTKALIGISLILPWVVLDMVLKKTDPSLGYSVGLFLGIMSGYLLSPKPPRLWVMLLIASLLAVSHFVFVPHY